MWDSTIVTLHQKMNCPMLMQHYLHMYYCYHQHISNVIKQYVTLTIKCRISTVYNALVLIHNTLHLFTLSIN